MKMLLHKTRIRIRDKDNTPHPIIFLAPDVITIYILFDYGRHIEAGHPKRTSPRVTIEASLEPPRRPPFASIVRRRLLTNAFQRIFFRSRREENTPTRTDQDKDMDSDPESDNELSSCMPSSSGRLSSSSDSTALEDADENKVDDGDIEAGRPKTSIRVTVAKRLKPEASVGFIVRRSLATSVGVNN